MKAVLARAYGGPEVLTLEDVDRPKPEAQHDWDGTGRNDLILDMVGGPPCPGLTLYQRLSQPTRPVS